MAVPKRRVSKTRGAKRRTHYTVTLPMPVKDTDGTWKMPHRVNKTTGEFKKAHKHGALFFESLKSYSQVSDLLSEKLNTPAHVEVVMSPKGMYDYFIHAENPDKTHYNIEEIESGCGFELDKFLTENNPDFLKQIYEVMRDSGLREFADFTDLIAQKHPDLLLYVFEKSYFFKIYLDSKRYNIRESKENEEEINGK